MSDGPDDARSASDRYSTFLSLSGDGDRALRARPAARARRPRGRAGRAHPAPLPRRRVQRAVRPLLRPRPRRRWSASPWATSSPPTTRPASRRSAISSAPATGWSTPRRSTSSPRVHRAGCSASALGAVQDGRLHDFWLCLARHHRAQAGGAGPGAARPDPGGGRLLGRAPAAARDPGGTQADEVLARLGEAARGRRGSGSARTDERPDGSPGDPVPRHVGGARLEVDARRPAHPGRLSRCATLGLERLAARAARGPAGGDARAADCSDGERASPTSMGSRAFAAVPIFASGRVVGRPRLRGDPLRARVVGVRRSRRSRPRRP